MLFGAACTGGSTASPVTPTTADSPPPSTAVEVSDGVLRIGLLLPGSGSASDFGRPLTAGANVAAREVNQAGGVGGQTILVIPADEGSDATTVAGGLDDLLAQDVDVIVGPAASTSALAVLRRATEQAVVCSPTATAMSLTDFPDRGRFFRTIPSDELAARAMAQVIARSGRRSAALLSPDDDFGERFSEVLARELAARKIEIREARSYDPSSDELDTAARQALDENPDILAVIGNEDAGGRMLAAVGNVEDRGILVYVNDAMRRSPLLANVKAAQGNFLSRVTGVSPRAVPDDPIFARTITLGTTSRSLDFASYAYDCVVAAALAAAAAGTDSPDELAAAMIDVSGGGSPCFSFVQCRDSAAQSFNIDYEGRSGPLDFDANGDVNAGVFEEFRFDEDGIDIPGDAVQVGG